MTSAPIPHNLANVVLNAFTKRKSAVIPPETYDATSGNGDDMQTPRLTPTKGGFTIFIPTPVAWLIAGGLLFGQPFLSTWAQNAFGGGQANAKAIEDAVSKALAPILQEIATMKADITLQFNAMDVRQTKLERASKATKETPKS